MVEEDFKQAARIRMLWDPVGQGHALLEMTQEP
jgi:hypothetical protein